MIERKYTVVPSFPVSMIRHRYKVSTDEFGCVMLKGLIMDGCVLLTSTPECVVSPRGETTHEGVDVNNTHPSAARQHTRELMSTTHTHP